MRQLKREVKIGNVTIGGKNPVAVQTMLNVPVEDIEGNVAQAKRCEAAGCQILRVTCPSPADAKCIEAVKNAVNIPIVADIHFDYKAALACADVGEKLLVPVLGKGEQQLINGGLRLTLRALLGQRKRGRKHLQLEGADTLGRSPQADKIVIVRVAAGHGTGGAARGNAVLFSLDDGKHPLQPFLRCIRLRGKAQTGVQHLVGVVRFGLVGGGPCKAHKGT